MFLKQNKYKNIGCQCKNILIALLLITGFNGISQSTIEGNPYITIFDKEEYGGGAQCWDSKLLPNGHLLIANDQGILEFDGERWTKYTLPNNSICRSIHIEKQRIYAGGQDEIGYFIPEDNGVLAFKSIREFIPEIYLPLQDVWQIESQDDKIVFRSVNRIYIFDPTLDTFKVIEPNAPIISFQNLENKIYYNDLYKGVISINDTSVCYSGSELLKFTPIISVLPSEEDTLFVTERFGIFDYKNGIITKNNPAVQEFMITNVAFCAIRTAKNRIAIGTQFGGILIINNSGEAIKIINRESGLSNNNIHTLCKDASGNLWAGTSNGINKVELSNPLRIIHPDNNENGTFYAIKQHDNKLYFGSNNSLYVTDLLDKNNPFQERKYAPVQYSEGQVWGLDVIDGDLLMGHNNGAYHIRNNRAELFSKEPGVWQFIQAKNKNEMYVGTYYGVHIYKKINGSWTFFKKLEGFIESSRIIISVIPNEVWVSHPYRGIYKIEHDDEYYVNKVSLYGEQKGLPSELNNYIFDIDGIPYVTGKTGVYRYNRKEDLFEIDPSINDHIDNTKNVRRLIRDKKDKLWYIAEHEVANIANTNDKSIDKSAYPSLHGKFVGGFEELYFLDNNQAMICANEMILSLDESNINADNRSNTFITRVKLSDTDSILYGGYSLFENEIKYHQSEEQIRILEPDQNAITFFYSTPSHIDEALYSYTLLDNQDSENIDWSPWVNSTSKEYNNLSHGDYAFHVKSQTSSGKEGSPRIYQFTIAPPWYLSIWAKLIYIFFALLALSALLFIPQKKFKVEKEILTSAKEESDAKLELVQTEKLKAEIEFKNTELASSTMHLVQKNETINKIRDEVKNVSKKIKDPEAKKEVRKILSLLTNDERLEDDWDNFSYHFDQVHTDFLKRISEAYPQLTPKDKKLCAYLRMNLTTKEIAPLLNISVRGVEISRYRLRKKLELDGSMNLNGFMMGY